MKKLRPITPGEILLEELPAQAAHDTEVAQDSLSEVVAKIKPWRAGIPKTAA